MTLELVPYSSVKKYVFLPAVLVVIWGRTFERSNELMLVEFESGVECAVVVETIAESALRRDVRFSRASYLATTKSRWARRFSISLCLARSLKIHLAAA